jgi:hypothetical protein
MLRAVGDALSKHSCVCMCGVGLLVAESVFLIGCLERSRSAKRSDILATTDVASTYK